MIKRRRQHVTLNDFRIALVGKYAKATLMSAKELDSHGGQSDGMSGAGYLPDNDATRDRIWIFDSPGST